MIPPEEIAAITRWLNDHEDAIAELRGALAKAQRPVPAGTGSGINAALLQSFDTANHFIVTAGGNFVSGDRWVQIGLPLAPRLQRLTDSEAICLAAWLLVMSGVEEAIFGRLVMEIKNT